MSQVSYPFPDPPKPGQTIEILSGIKWVRMPLPGALSHINLYLLEDRDGWFIVDTGLDIEHVQLLWRNIFEHELDGKPVIGIIVTHMHPDHLGQANWLMDHWQAPLYMSNGEFQQAHRFYRPATAELRNNTIRFYCNFGMDLKTANERTELWLDKIWPGVDVPGDHITLEQGTEMTIGNHHWQVIIGQGHSPEHACLYSPDLNLLISGDQILPKITSNVSVHPDDPEKEPMSLWLKSLQAFLHLPENTLVLPAHNLPFFGLHQRANTITQHHHANFELLERACGKARVGLDLIPVLYRRELNMIEWAFAIGECSAHLNYLFIEERLSRDLNDAGHYQYQINR